MGMIDRRDVHEVRLEIRGNEPPHEWTLTVEGFCREKLDDRVIEVFHEHGGEMVPDIVAAIERVVMSRLRHVSTDNASKPAAIAASGIEDFEI